MKKPRFTEQQIAQALRQAEQGTTAAEICRKLGVSEATFYAWKKRYVWISPNASRGSSVEQMQDDGGVLRIVLVPGVVHRLPVAGPGHRRDRDHWESFPEQSVSQGAVEVASRLERDPDRPRQSPQERDQAVVVVDAVGHTELLTSSVGALDQDRMEALTNVYRDEPGL
jgi:putative transposase